MSEHARVAKKTLVNNNLGNDLFTKNLKKFLPYCFFYPQIKSKVTIKFREFFGPQMALAYWLDAISQGPKNSRIPGPNPLPLPLVMDMHASKTLCTGLYKS
jgi:hypothetical protein